MTAGMPVKNPPNKTLMIPQTKLAVASPQLWEDGMEDCILTPVFRFRPQFTQSTLSVLTFAPQDGQLGCRIGSE